MASIIKRRNKYALVYNYENEEGEKKQKWETFSTMAEAKKRKVQVEYHQSTNTFIAPTARTVRELIEEYVKIYGLNVWAFSTYDGRRGIIDNYINPLLGDMKLDDLTPRVMDHFYQSLLKVKAKQRPYQKREPEYISVRTIREIHKVLRCAFNQAVKWELMLRNPVLNATLPKEEEKRREIWTPEILFKAIGVCEDDMLTLAMNLAFSCSMRIGEMLGLTWDCVDISSDSIQRGRAFISIEKELQRASKQSLNDLTEKAVIFRFPAIIGGYHTTLILKKPKTKTSIRKVYLPKTVAELLVERKKEIEEMKAVFGHEFRDYNLVFCSAMGRPIEGQVINRALSKLIRDNDLPKVVFHSLRHTSTTYKLKLSGGDIKAVQGDTGHAQASMVTEQYAHIIDEDRRKNTELLEKRFYEQEDDFLEAKKEQNIIEGEMDNKKILELLSRSPEMLTLFKEFASAL